MTERDFCYWLQGYCEVCGELPTREQWDMIKEHLGIVFDKQTKTLEDFLQPMESPFTDSLPYWKDDDGKLYCADGTYLR